jgi:hypothetical protein
LEDWGRATESKKAEGEEGRLWQATSSCTTALADDLMAPPTASDSPAQVDLMIVMNARIDSWEKKLPKDTKKLLKRSRTGG